jgi:hypothetical protein
MIQVHAFKKKEKEGGDRRPQFGGPWKVSSLVALGMKRRNIFFIFSFSPQTNFT